MTAAPLSFVDPAVEEYCVAKSSVPPPLCGELEEFTKETEEMSGMLVGKLEASLLGLLVRAVGARRVLEVGTFTGYSALCMAHHLPEDGELVTLDRSEAVTAKARKFWARSPHGRKIRLVLGDAGASMARLEGPFDLVFIDADKEDCVSYLRRALELLSPSGLVVVDNCLWGGRVLGDGEADAETRGIRALTDFVTGHDGLHATLLPVRDGIYLIKPTGSGPR